MKKRILNLNRELRNFDAVFNSTPSPSAITAWNENILPVLQEDFSDSIIQMSKPQDVEVLSGFKFCGLDLRLNFDNCLIADCDFTNSKISGSMTGTVWESTSIRGTSFDGLNLSGSDFSPLAVAEEYYEGARFKRITLEPLHQQDLSLKFPDFSNMDLSKFAKGSFDDDKMLYVITNSETIMPLDRKGEKIQRGELANIRVDKCLLFEVTGSAYKSTCLQKLILKDYGDGGGELGCEYSSKDFLIGVFLGKRIHQLYEVFSKSQVDDVNVKIKGLDVPIQLIQNSGLILEINNLKKIQDFLFRNRGEI